MKKFLVLLLLTGCADRLSQVNEMINRRPYVAGTHDCRNFAEEKYQALIKDGYKSEQMKFVITNFQGDPHKPHVVLNVDGVILDNNRKPYYATKNLQNGLTYETWNYWRSHEPI